MDSLKILTYLPQHIKSYGIGYAATSLAISMNSSNIESKIFSLRSDLIHHSDKIKHAFDSEFFYKLYLKFLGYKYLSTKTENIFKKLLPHYDMVYLWPACSVESYRYAKSLGKTIVMESINCHQVAARNILNNEAIGLGLSDIHLITDDSIQDENLKVSISDYIFCPSPNVTKSMLDNGIDAQKLIETSYGLGEHQRHYPEKNNLRTDELNGLFVGSGIIRKGIHLLLEYWRDAHLNGKLVIIGTIDPAIEHIVRPYRDDPQFEFINFTNNIDQFYKKADVFLLPSLEEGSPLVTYLAIGAGLPCIVSPMGGEGVIRHGIEGYILEPHDKMAWISTLLSLAQQPSKRRELSLAAYERSEYFLWHNVGKRRTDALMTRIGEKQ